MARKEKVTRKYIDFVYLTIFYAFFGLIYFHNITRDIIGGDVGDLVTSAISHGVAHPPGYPLFIALGFFVSNLQIPILPVTKIAMISVVSSLISLFFLKSITSFFTKNLFFQLLTTSILGFSYLFWLYSEIPEVFALNICLTLGSIFFALKFFKQSKFVFLVFSVLFYGLGLSNHLTIILTTPILITFVFLRRSDIVRQRFRILYLPGAFFLGLFPYLYLPIASSTHPIIEWNNINSLTAFFHHVLRKDYGTFAAGYFNQPHAEAKLYLLKAYFESLFFSISIPVVIISAIGLIRGFFKDKAITVSILTSFLLAGPFFVTYSGFPISDYFVLGIAERFYLLSQVLFLLFVPWGLESIKEFFYWILSRKIYAHVIVSVFILIPIFLLKLNFDRTNLSDTTMGTDFAKNYVRNLPKDSILLLSGDTRSFNLWYVHYILGFRKDIEIVQLGDFGIRSAYFEKLRSEIREEMGLEGSRLFINTLLKAAESKPVFSMIETKIPNDYYAWLSIGLVHKLYMKEDLPDKHEYSTLIASMEKNINIPDLENSKPVESMLTLRSILTYYASASVNIGNTYLTKYNDKKAAQLYYTRAILIDPTFSESYANLAKIYLLEGRCANAEKNIKRAIEFFPSAASYYATWYKIADECFVKKDERDEVKKQFSKTFNMDLLKVIKVYEKSEKE